MPQNALFTYLSDQPCKALLDYNHPAWGNPERITIDRDWQGRSCLDDKDCNWKNLTEVTSLWNAEVLFFFFQCWYDELTVDQQKPHDRSAQGLWESDVVEVFLKPESCDDYFEIELSPLGQWLDAHILKPRVDVDFHWESKLQVKVDVAEMEGIWRVVVGIPFEPIIEATLINRPPEVGEAWRLNLCRIAGQKPAREFLAWRPTFTRGPDFHVPSAFGNLIFLRE